MGGKMFKRLILTSILLLVLTSVNVNAQKGYDQSMALDACGSCEYLMTSDEIQFGGEFLEQSSHTFTFNSDAHTDVSELFIYLKINATGHTALEYEIDWLYTDTASTLDSIIYGDPSGKYLKIKMIPSTPDEFDNIDIFTINIYLTQCLGYTDSVHLEFKDSSGAFINRYNTTSGGSTDYYPTLTSGYRYYEEPAVKLTTTGIMDSTYVGGTATATLVLDSLNFKHEDSYEFTVAFDSELDYNSFTTTDYSGTPTISNITDTTIDVSLSSGGPAAPTTFPADFLHIDFDVDVTADPDANYKVRIKDDYIFTGCTNYADTNDNAGAYGYLKTVEERAWWKLDTVVVVVATENYSYYFSMKNNAPLYTDVVTSEINAGFAVDSSVITHTDPKSISTEFSYEGGTLRWSRSKSTDTLIAAESSSLESVTITPEFSLGNLVFDNVGFLVVDADVVGTDVYKFIEVEPDSMHKAFNRVVIKHTNDTLIINSLDAMGNGYGALSLIRGEFTVRVAGGGGGCPTLYSWYGSGYVLENTILTHSQGNLNPEIKNDFYPLSNRLIEDDGYFHFEIRELENEITFLDEVELVMVIYDENTKVGISNEGKVFTYTKAIAPLSATDSWGRDLMEYIGKEDGYWMDVDWPGYMILSFPNPASGEYSETVMNGFALGPGGGPQKKTITFENTGGEGESIIAEIQDINGNWYYLGSIPSREYQSENTRWYADLTDIELGETFNAKISWKVSYKADYQALFVGQGTDFTEHRITPSEAVHSVAGKLVAGLSYEDGNMATIQPGEKIQLSFKIPEYSVIKGKKIKYFFKSRGYYKTLNKEELIPETYSLHNNYPNPFNPSTTISFSIPKVSEIELSVINILGQVVRTLHDGQITAGNHEVVWDGKNESGSQVASGVYFYRLKADGFEDSKKMVMLK